MNNDNPAEMSNADLEKAMQENNGGNNATGNRESVTKTTAAEGTLKTPAEDISSAVSHHTSYNTNEEQDPDDLVHRRAQEEDSQDGSLPSPDDTPEWEDNDTDNNKISG